MKFWKNFFITVGIILAVLIVAFFITTFICAGVHGNGIVAEWDSWINWMKGTKEVAEAAAPLLLN